MNRDAIVRLFTDRRGETSDLGGDDARPVVYTDEQPREILQSTLAVVREGNDPCVLFRCADRLVRLCSNGDRETAHPVPLSKHGLYRLLIELADWRKRTANGETASSPPSRILDAILEDAGQSVPELDVFTTVPMFGKDFELMDTPGYHANERLYFQDVHGLGDIGSDRMDVAEARGLLMEAICDFPFTEEAGKAHAIGLMLLPFIRRAIGAGSTPLHVIGSACPGSGKGRLADLVSVIATGESCTPTTLGAGAYENAKKLTSLLLAGTLAGCPIVLLDNVPQDRILDDAALASFLTSTRPTDRLLGGNRMATLRNQAVWILTANNLRCTTEISRRSVRIRIDPQTDRPWLRNSFLHGDVLEWARRNRRSLVRACVSLVLAWIEVGRPRPLERNPFGVFRGMVRGLGRHPGSSRNTRVPRECRDRAQPSGP